MTQLTSLDDIDSSWIEHQQLLRPPHEKVTSGAGSTSRPSSSLSGSTTSPLSSQSDYEIVNVDEFSSCVRSRESMDPRVGSLAVQTKHMTHPSGPPMLAFIPDTGSQTVLRSGLTIADPALHNLVNDRLHPWPPSATLCGPTPTVGVLSSHLHSQFTEQPWTSSEHDKDYRCQNSPVTYQSRSTVNYQPWSDYNDFNGPAFHTPQSSVMSGMILPSSLEHVRDLLGQPWSPFDDEPILTSMFPSSSQRVVNSTMDTDLLSNTTDDIAGGSDLNRVGRRTGQLDAKTRENANLVRKERSCLRCFVYKETCDTNRNSCQNCAVKHPRTWKLGCVRPRLMFRTEYLLPDVLTSRLEIKYIKSFVGNKGWVCVDRPRFCLPLEIGIGDLLLNLPVQEFLPNDTTERSALVRDEEGKVVATSLYDLPVAFACDDHGEQQQMLKRELGTWTRRLLSELPENDFAWTWFEGQHEHFAGSIMQLITEYYQSHLASHDMLKKALCVAIFNHTFNKIFRVPEDKWHIVKQKMEATIPDDKIWMTSTILNLYIKMMLLQPLRFVITQALKGLEELLLRQHLHSEWRKDIIFCISFILISYVGKLQYSLLQLAHQTPSDSRRTVSVDDAMSQIHGLEASIIDIIVKYHEQFLQPSLRRKKTHPAGSTSDDAESEKHAQEFGLMDQVRQLYHDNYESMPESLEPNFLNAQDFFANNTSRACWKYVSAVLALDRPGKKSDG